MIERLLKSATNSVNSWMSPHLVLSKIMFDLYLADSLPILLQSYTKYIKLLVPVQVIAQAARPVHVFKDVFQF